MSNNVIVINGPNLGRLGLRQPEIYGSKTIVDLKEFCSSVGAQLGLEVSTYQSDSLDQILHLLQQAEANRTNVILNAGSFTHYCYELANFVSTLSIIVIEVHISNLSKREEFRKKSVLAPAVKGSIAGFGFDSYRLALTLLAEHHE